MIDVTVLFLDGTFSSTAIDRWRCSVMPESCERPDGEASGSLLSSNYSVGGGRAVQCDGPIQIRPAAALTAIRKTELIFIPSTGPSVDDVVERNESVVPGCGVGISAELPLPAYARAWPGCRCRTARRQTRNYTWALAEQFRQKYPKVRWMPELMVTEDHGFYCGGGVHASLDLSLYWWRNSAPRGGMQTAKALLVETRELGRPGSLSSL